MNCAVFALSANCCFFVLFSTPADHERSHCCCRFWLQRIFIHWKTAEQQSTRGEQNNSKWWLCSFLSIGSIVNNAIIIMLNSTSSSQWWLTLSTASPNVVTRRNKHIFNLCQLILDWAASCWDKLLCFYTTAILKSCCWLSRFNLGNYPKSPHSGMLWSGLCLDLGWNWEMLVGSFLICNSKYQEAQRRVSHCFKKLQ